MVQGVQVSKQSFEVAYVHIERDIFLSFWASKSASGEAHRLIGKSTTPHVFIFQTLFAAWQVGALSNTYLQSSLEKFTTQMSDIENHHLAPPGWRAVWDRYDPFSFYFFSLRHFLWKIRSWKFREINELMWNLLLTRVEIEMLETIIGNQSGDQKFDNPGLKSRAW